MLAHTLSTNFIKLFIQSIFRATLTRSAHDLHGVALLHGHADALIKELGSGSWLTGLEFELVAQALEKLPRIIAYMAPCDSTTKGTNSYRSDSSWYFRSFALALSSATEPAHLAEDFNAEELAILEQQKKSHMSYFPRFQGTSVRPSGLFPSFVLKPGGSMTDR